MDLPFYSLLSNELDSFQKYINFDPLPDFIQYEKIENEVDDNISTCSEYIPDNLINEEMIDDNNTDDISSSEEEEKIKKLYKIKIKPARGKIKRYPSSEWIPKVLNSNPYKYYLKITIPFSKNDDFDIYLRLNDIEIEDSISYEYENLKIKQNKIIHIIKIGFNVNSFKFKGELFDLCIKHEDFKFVSTKFEVIARRNSKVHSRTWSNFK